MRARLIAEIDARRRGGAATFKGANIRERDELVEEERGTREDEQEEEKEEEKRGERGESRVRERKRETK